MLDPQIITRLAVTGVKIAKYTGLVDKLNDLFPRTPLTQEELDRIALYEQLARERKARRNTILLIGGTGIALTILFAMYI